MPQSVIVRLTSRAEKPLRQRNKWRQRFDHGTFLNILAVILDKILHLKPFSKTFNPYFRKMPFLQTVKITEVMLCYM